MWTWANIENSAAIYLATGEPSIFCGINVDPLASWIAEGNEPEAYLDDNEELDSK
jgi:hypothetical protein